MSGIVDRLDAASNGLRPAWLRSLLQDARSEIAALRARAAIVDRNPEGEDPEEGLRAKHESDGAEGNRPDSSVPEILAEIERLRG